MPNLQGYMVLDPNDTVKATALARNTAGDLEDKRTTLLEVVQSLSPFINDDDASTRSRAVQYFSEVIQNLPRNLLSRQQVEVVCHFLCDRIEDGGALTGLAMLQETDKFNASMAVMTFRAATKSFLDSQQRTQSVRYQILQLLNGLMSHHRPALKEIGSEFIVGFLDLVSGEKDPRNLMIVFSILRAILMEWDISADTEALFDAVFCYFPITFRPPPNDPYGITAQDLKSRLRDCVSANQLFAPYAFSQLLDKLDSPSSSVKKDVLQTITACVSSYGATMVSNYSITLWDSLKYEILNAQEVDVADEALECLQAIATRLSPSTITEEKATDLVRYLKPILTECREQLPEPAHKKAKSAGRILGALGSVSTSSSYLIVTDVIPPWMTMYQDADSISQRKAFLEILIQLLTSSVAVFHAPRVASPTRATDSPLLPFKENFLQLGIQALMGTATEEVSYRIAALHVLLQLCLLPHYLDSNEVVTVVQCFNEALITQDPGGRDDLKKEAIQALIQISKTQPNVIMDKTLPALMSHLPDAIDAGLWAHLVILESLAQLSTEKHVSDTIVRRLFNKLDAVLVTRDDPKYAQDILSTIQVVLCKENLLDHGNALFYYHKVNTALVQRLVLSSLGRAKVSALNDVATMQTLGRLLKRIIQSLDEKEQLSASFGTYTFSLQDNSFPPIPFRKKAKPIEESTMILSTYILASVPSTIPPDFLRPFASDYYHLLKALVETALSDNETNVHRTILQQVGLVSNKFLPKEQMRDALLILKGIHSELQKPSPATQIRVKVIFWLAKGLILRLAMVENILQDLLQLLELDHCNLLAARGFGLLLTPDEIISRESGATIRMLANQKVFNACIPTIARQSRKGDPAMRSGYLIALCGITKHVPLPVLMPEFENLLPLLLQSLDLDDVNIKAAAIENLRVVCLEHPAAIEGHAGSLVQRLLKSVNNPVKNSVNVRQIALHCLQSLPGRIKESALLPYKNSVTRGLLIVLDDPKRSVRKAAVDCRAAWLGMDEPQSD